VYAGAPGRPDRRSERPGGSDGQPGRAAGSVPDPPEPDRDTVRIRVVHGLEYRDIANRLNGTERTARKWVSLVLRPAGRIARRRGQDQAQTALRWREVTDMAGQGGPRQPTHPRRRLLRRDRRHRDLAHAMAIGTVTTWFDGWTSYEVHASGAPVSRAAVIAHLALHNTNPNPLVEGPTIVLAPVHRKVRRAGYRQTTAH
jgi:hypothetical protein